MKRGRQLNGWLYGELVKEFQMWVTSSLPSQHNKADFIIKQFSKKSNFIDGIESSLS